MTDDVVRTIEEIQKAAMVTFGTALRSSTIAGVSNLQHIQLGFMHWLEGLDELPRGTPLDATGFHDFLKSQGVQGDPAAEIILLLQSMEDRLGFLVKLPAEVAKLSETKRQVLLEKHQKRARAPTFVQAPTAAPGAPSGPDTPSRGAYPKKKKLPQGAGLAIFGALAIGGVYSIRFFEEPPPPPLEQMNLSLPPEAFSCRELVKVSKLVVCKIPKAEWDAIPTHEIERRTAATFKAVSSEGFTNLVVKLAEDGKTVAGR